MSPTEIEFLLFPFSEVLTEHTLRQNMMVAEEELLGIIYPTEAMIANRYNHGCEQVFTYGSPFQELKNSMRKHRAWFWCKNKRRCIKESRKDRTACVILLTPSYALEKDTLLGKRKNQAETIGLPGVLQESTVISAILNSTPLCLWHNPEPGLHLLMLKSDNSLTKYSWQNPPIVI